MSTEYCWLDGGQDYVVCAFYTPDYAAHATQLRHSLEALGINHFLKLYESAGSWEANTRIKPRFIAHCLAQLQPKHVLCVDADAVVRQPLQLLDEITTDIAICIKSVQQYLYVNVGTIYVRNTTGGRRFVEEWVKAGKKAGRFTVDSQLLHRVFGNSPGFSLTILPSSYRTISDAAPVGTVIQHFQVSRHRMGRLASLMRKALRLIASN
jgi:hypothetical protein